MPGAIDRHILIALCAAGLVACNSEPSSNQDILIDTNVPADAEFETLPPDETVIPPPGDENVAVPDTRSPEERGDGGDMVNIVDDTGNNRSGR